MPPVKIDEFLEEIVSYVKFPFAKEGIKLELRDHILDKISDYMGQGYDQEKAQQQAIEEMGDPEEIGTLLNKQHNPFLGWILTITNVMVVILLICTIFPLGSSFIYSVFSRSLVHDMAKKDIVYKIDVDEKVKLDDTIIHFTNVVYDINGELNIFYQYYDTRLWGTGWSSGGVGDITDNFGNTYLGGGGGQSGGLITNYGVKRVRDFAEDAHTLIINYDYYNRYYRVEIPLKAGDINDQR